MKKWMIVLGSIVAVGIAGGFIFNSKFNEMTKYFSEYTLKAIDLRTIPDGTYNGKCKVFLAGIDLDVKVLNHKIADIKIIDQKCGKGYEGRLVIDRVLKGQSLENWSYREQ